jgi:esterase FrsA
MREAKEAWTSEDVVLAVTAHPHLLVAQVGTVVSRKAWPKMRLLLGVLLALVVPTSVAQPAERTIDEIKVEAQARAEKGAYPLIGLDVEDVRQALAMIRTRDPDEWASAWSKVADQYYKRAEVAISPEEKRANFLRAWRLYYFAQWPVASSAGKKAAAGKALDAYVRSAQLASPKIEVVHIPFEGKEIVGYLRLPSGATTPVPLVLAVSGLDSRKENLQENYAALVPRGIALFTVDGPGTGQSPVKVSTTADRALSRVIDYLRTREEIDPSRIVLHGVSFGGYWASKLAIVERSRLRGVVVQSPPIHTFFQRDWVASSLLGNKEYLFDTVPSFLSIADGVSNEDDLLREFPRLSLTAQGLLGKPTPPMLLIGGVKDTLVPISDAYLMLSNGDLPKDAWINPIGAHLGRGPNGWTDPEIFRKVIMPWEVRILIGDDHGSK